MRLHLRPASAPRRGSARAGGEPAVEILPGALDHARRAAAAPDRRPAFREGLGREHAFLDGPASLPIDGLTAPQRAAQAKTFHEPADALVEGNARGLELRANRRH